MGWRPVLAFQSPQRSRNGLSRTGRSVEEKVPVGSTRSELVGLSGFRLVFVRV